MNNLNSLDRVYVAGHRGMVGSALMRKLGSLGFSNIITASHSELDLINQSAVENFFKTYKPDQVYIAAAKVGGILANNSYPADFIYQNLMIQSNIINSAFNNRVKKLIFLGSSCIYPKYANHPIVENELLSGKLEETNEPYAIAKIAGIKLCESYNRQYGSDLGIDYRCVMPTNLYGPGDNYHPQNSHVIPALIRRFHEAKINQHEFVDVWGSGKPRREFLHVDDLADACIRIMHLDKETFSGIVPQMNSHINVGTGEDITIQDLAKKIKKIIGFEGDIRFDNSKPDGTPKKLLNIDLIKSFDWSPKVDLEQGLISTYQDFLNN